MTASASKLPLTLLSVVLALVIVLLAMGVIFGAYVFVHRATGTAAQHRGSIMVTATGVAYALPDEAVVSMVVNATGGTSQQAVSNLSSELIRLNSTLYNYVGMNTSRISTGSYSVYKTHNASTFTAEESITATLPNTSETGSLLGSLSAIPNVYVNGVSAKMSNSWSAVLMDSALTAAMQNATQQADAIAAPYTATMTNVSVDNYYVYPYALSTGIAGGALPIAEQNASPTYYPGRSEVVERISATFSYG